MLAACCALIVASAWADPGVAESTIVPDRLILSRGYVNYNYNVHKIEVEVEGQRETMYRYYFIRLSPGATTKEIESQLSVKKLDSKDTVSLDGKAPLCTDTEVPQWGVAPK